jgi:SulP family sulfate permease
MQRWFPIGAWIKGYDWRGSTAADLIAAVSVAALLIPESRGYTSVAGVPAEIGLFAAPLALLFYAMFGGSTQSLTTSTSRQNATRSVTSRRASGQGRS